MALLDEVRLGCVERYGDHWVDRRGYRVCARIGDAIDAGWVWADVDSVVLTEAGEAVLAQHRRADG
jgi:hypothetical protein